jgi:hypothetical protein
MAEHLVEKYAARVAKRHGCWPLKLAMLGGRGWPDHTIFTEGRVVFIEYKVPGGKFQPLQKLIHRKLKGYGFLVAVCSTKEDVDRFFEEHISGT